MDVEQTGWNIHVADVYTGSVWKIARQTDMEKSDVVPTALRVLLTRWLDLISAYL